MTKLNGLLTNFNLFIANTIKFFITKLNEKLSNERSSHPKELYKAMPVLSILIALLPSSMV